MTALGAESAADATGPMMLTDIDHVAIAVRDLDAAIDHYRTWFGAARGRARAMWSIGDSSGTSSSSWCWAK